MKCNMLKLILWSNSRIIFRLSRKFCHDAWCLIYSYSASIDSTKSLSSTVHGAQLLRSRNYQSALYSRLRSSCHCLGEVLNLGPIFPHRPHFRCYGPADWDPTLLKILRNLCLNRFLISSYPDVFHVMPNELLFIFLRVVPSFQNTVNRTFFWHLNRSQN